MTVEGLIPWLVQGPFPFFALIIGVVVSMDVAGFEFARDYKKEDRNGKSLLWTSRMRTMMILHAGFHSISFFVYMIFIYLVQLFFFLFIDILGMAEDIGPSLLTQIDFFIVVYIWWIYKSKVKEDYSEKSDDSEVAGRKGMKFLVDYVRAVYDRIGFGDKVTGAAVAGSVVVDMLAVSALLKGVLLPNGEEAPIASWTGILFLDLYVFASIIFTVMAIVVMIIQIAGTKAREYFGIVLFLRVLKSFTVFFILAGVARLLADQFFESLPDVYTVYGDLIDAIFAMVVTFSLFWYNGIRWQNLKVLYAKRSEDENSMNPPIPARKLLDEWKEFFAAILVVCTVIFIMFLTVFLCTSLAYSTDPGRETHNYLVEATGYIASMMLVATIAFLYVPSKRLEDMVKSGTEYFHKMFFATPMEIAHRLVAFFIALLALNTHTFLILGWTIESELMCLWSVYVMLACVLFNSRRWRIYKSHAAGRTNPTNDAYHAYHVELFAAVGLASSVVALGVSVFFQ